MSRTIDHAPAAAGPAMAAAPAVARTPLAVVTPRRLRLFSSEAETERQWLQEGFDPPQPDLEDFLAQAPPAALSNTTRIAGVLFLTMVALAVVLRVDIIVSATGRLAADTPTIVLQPMQLSVIRQIRVRPGDVVHKGDVLAALDPTFAQADRAVLVAQQGAVRAELARLEAELDGTPFEAAAGWAKGAASQTGKAQPGEPKAAGPELVLQQTLFRQRRAQYVARLADFGQRLQASEVEGVAADQSRVSMAQQVALSREVEGMRGALYRSQSGSKLQYLEAQAARMRNERDLQAATAHLNAVQQGARATLADQQAYIDGWRRELLEALVKVRAEALAVDESLTKANRLNELVVLAAPEDGVVLEVGKRSVGSVLNAAEPLITMLPRDAALIAEVLIGSADVGYAKPGDPVALKVDAFPYQRHGLLPGRLRSIGADSFASGGASGGAAAGSSAVHRGQVEIAAAGLRGLPEGARLIPGMTVTAEIKVGTRRVISYLLYPVLRGLNESIREP